jgi:hypothetical protein
MVDASVHLKMMILLLSIPGVLWRYLNQDYKILPNKDLEL